MDGREKGISARQGSIGHHTERSGTKYADGIGHKIEPIARAASRERGLQHLDQAAETHRPAQGQCPKRAAEWCLGRTRTGFRSSGAGTQRTFCPKHPSIASKEQQMRVFVDKTHLVERRFGHREQTHDQNEQRQEERKAEMQQTVEHERRTEIKKPLSLPRHGERKKDLKGEEVGSVRKALCHGARGAERTALKVDDRKKVGAINRGTSVRCRR